MQLKLFFELYVYLKVTFENIKRMKHFRLFPVLDTLLTCSKSIKQLVNILKIFPKEKNGNTAARVNFFLSHPHGANNLFFASSHILFYPESLVMIKYHL